MGNKTNYFVSFLFCLFSLTGCTSCSKEESRPDQAPEPLPTNEIREIFEFKMDESSGSSTNEVQTGNSFTIEGKSVSRMTGVRGSSLFFDGLSNQVTGELPANLMPNKNFLLSVWAAPKSYPIGTAAILALNSQGASSGLSLGINKFGQIVVKYHIDGTAHEEVTTESIERNLWNHIVVGISPEKNYLIIYVNNIPVHTSDVPSGSLSWQANNVPVKIGKNTTGEKIGIYDVDYFSGSIDEIKIYAGEATQQNVAHIASVYAAPEQVSFTYAIDFSGDTNRSRYHPVPDYGWANESYGLVHQGNSYHMFYQKNDVFLGIAQQNWGHLTSPDLIHWEEQNAVLWPTEGWDHHGIWSGCSMILEDGTPAVVYTGVDGVKAGMGTAFSQDNYQTLVKNDDNPIIPSAPMEVDMDFRDPFVWHKNGQYHMVIGSGISSIGANVVYYSSDDFENWTYGGIAYQGQKNEGEGQFWEMPVRYEFPNGKEMLLVQKTPDNTPAVTTYWIGDFVDGKFIPDFAEAKKLEVVNGFLSPTVTTDNAGNITAIGIIPDEVSPQFQMEQGWANLFSLPQVWTLNAAGDIIISPHPDLAGLRGEQQQFNGIALTDGDTDYLNGYTGRHFEMSATVETGDADQVGFIFGKTPDNGELYRIYYDMTTQEWVVDASRASMDTRVRKDIRKGAYAIEPGSTFDVRIFVDGSVVEVFVDGKSHFTGRFFPTSEHANGVGLFATGGAASANITIFNMDQ